MAVYRVSVSVMCLDPTGPHEGLIQRCCGSNLGGDFAMVKQWKVGRFSWGEDSYISYMYVEGK